LTELERIDLRKPRVMLRLRWAAYRAGHAALREALDAPVPSGSRCRSSEPTPPWGHPDFVLARAVAERVITASEAELIGSTRLEDHPLADAARQRGVSYQAAAQARRRAEHRLATYLSDAAEPEGSACRGDRDLESHAVHSAIITTAAREASAPHQESPSVAKPGRGSPEKSRVGVLKQGPETGVQGCAGTPTSPARIPSAAAPVAPSSQTPEVPRCA
ncbi:MAG: hypothetical protein ACREQ5_24880, partial [Candidatus Dormibacteria bacterium]